MRALLCSVLVLWTCSVSLADELQQMKSRHVDRAIAILLQNVSPEGAAPGTIIASPSRNTPNYFRHWVRDGGHVVSVIISLWERAEGGQRLFLEKLLWDFVLLSGRQQQFIHEPVFNPDGSPITEDWGRPQPDGPALRAIPLIRFAHGLLNQNRAFDVGHFPTRPNDLKQVIITDIEAILSHGDYGYDIWEELRGFHFYTRMVQRKALLTGANFLRRVGENALAERCEQALPVLEAKIRTHWDSNLGYLLSTVGADGRILNQINEGDGIRHKKLHLDSQTILGVLHGDTHDDFFAPDDEKVLATVFKLEAAFRGLYPINRNGIRGIGIGRYPEDDWDGYSRGREGNPWLITTEAFGEYHDRLAHIFQRKGYIDITPTNLAFFWDLLPTAQIPILGRIERGNELFPRLIEAIRAKADGYYERVLFHLGDTGDFHEQFNRHNGFLQGPPKLTWSCVAFIVGNWVRSSR